MASAAAVCFLLPRSLGGIQEETGEALSSVSERRLMRRAVIKVLIISLGSLGLHLVNKKKKKNVLRLAIDCACNKILLYVSYTINGVNNKELY